MFELARTDRGMKSFSLPSTYSGNLDVAKNKTKQNKCLLEITYSIM